MTTVAPLPQVSEVVNLLVISNEEASAQAQAPEGIPITKAENTINTKMDNMIKALEAWTFQVSKVNELRYSSKMYFSHWELQGVSGKMWSVKLDRSISGYYETLHE
jgi:hypothetical protein